MNQSTATKLTLNRCVAEGDPRVAIDFLAQHSGLSKRALKGAMEKGAVWLTRKGRQRLRRATAELRSGDRLELYYDAQVLALAPPPPTLLHDRGRYSFWYKAPGVLAQGNEYGDHASLLRQVERQVAPQRQAFLVHRLDREAHGVMLIAHDGKAAARLSELFAQHRLDKQYRIAVVGDIRPTLGLHGCLDSPLDGKAARTDYRIFHYDAANHASIVDVQLLTGRLHQIRRHFDKAGHPLLGDPRYGRNNRDPRGLQLVARLLSFTCPFSHQRVEVAVSDEVMDTAMRDLVPSRQCD